MTSELHECNWAHGVYLQSESAGRMPFHRTTDFTSQRPTMYQELGIVSDPPRKCAIIKKYSRLSIVGVAMSIHDKATVTQFHQGSLRL